MKDKEREFEMPSKTFEKCISSRSFESLINPPKKSFSKIIHVVFILFILSLFKKLLNKS